MASKVVINEEVKCISFAITFDLPTLGTNALDSHARAKRHDDFCGISNISCSCFYRERN